ncbi:hypothetical protein [Phyllobacterium myrsinacearum]|uniref:Uncharacterized protein n=1 Tax=Phyllobacterium myrsinacearum TaxID=28101 RepID=A0A839EUH3_9HYPH|nr:hypothetical protein [Phyllobacterium myrsinacearum]MBA8881755.1 hypothetical protein [Phyllobacterium myrsinacearum]
MREQFNKQQVFDLRDKQAARPVRQKLGFPGKSKEKRWSHQDDLDRLVGKEISVAIILSGVEKYVKGTLLAADQYFIKLSLPLVDLMTGSPVDNSIRVYSKSIIIYFSEVK